MRKLKIEIIIIILLAIVLSYVLIVNYNLRSEVNICRDSAIRQQEMLLSAILKQRGVTNRDSLLLKFIQEP